MTLKELLSEGKLRPHRTSAKEISDLLKVSERDLADAAVKGLSTDRSFTIAYGAILQLATMALYSSGYKTYGSAHHYTTFQALREILPADCRELMDYFDACRSKRNVSDYDRAGGITEDAAAEILTEARRFKKTVMDWLKINHSKLISVNNIK
ncbi:MAG: hypothetical protein V1701_11570 [Planctomycetota bacterium]